MPATPAAEIVSSEAECPSPRPSSCPPGPPRDSSCWPRLPFAKSKRRGRGGGYGGYTLRPGVALGDAKPAVLVVDDEPAIRLLCRVNLELEGCRVLEAST